MIDNHGQVIRMGQDFAGENAPAGAARIVMSERHSMGNELPDITSGEFMQKATNTIDHLEL